MSGRDDKQASFSHYRLNDSNDAAVVAPRGHGCPSGRVFEESNSYRRPDRWWAAMLGMSSVIGERKRSKVSLPPESVLFGKGSGTMFPVTYVQPVAYHRFATDRLLLKDESDTWYLWMGDASGLIEIDRQLAKWIYQRPEIYAVAGPAMWFDVDSLPVGSGSRPMLHD